MAEMKIVNFSEDSFDLEKLKKEANLHTRAAAREKKVRRKMEVAKIVIIVALFIAGYCVYYIASDLISRYEYNKYHNTDYLDSE